MKNPDYDQIKDLNMDLLKNDVIKITEFLTEFNSKKKIRHVEIIRDSLTSREEMIRNTATLGEYQNIYNSMRSHPSNNQGFTIYDQLRYIRRKFNLPANTKEIQ